MLLDRRLLEQLKKTPVLFSLAVLAGLIGGLLVIAQAWLVSQVIAPVFLDGAELLRVRPFLAALLPVLVLRPVVQAGGNLAAARLGERIKVELRDSLLERQLRGKLWLAKERSGELAEVFGTGVESMDAYFSLYLPQLIQAVLLPVAMLVFVVRFDPLSALIMLLTAPLIPLFMVLLGRTAEGRTRRQFAALGKMSAYFLDVIQGITTLKMLGNHRQGARIRQVSERYRDVTLSVLRWTFLSALALELIATISTAVLAVQIGLRLLDGSMSFQPALFILLIAPEFYQPLRQLGLRFHSAVSGVTAADRIYTLLEERGDSGSRIVFSPRKAESLPAPIQIEVDRVSYSYPGRDADALHDLSITLPAGQVTAVVGESGSGKTTLLHVILGLIRPDYGKIRANGQDIDEIPLDIWWQRLVWVPQSPSVFAGSLFDHIAMGKPGASRSEVEEAARWAGLGGLLARRPEGLSANPGESGQRLSGGEIQRVAMARAWLRSAPMWLLDEPAAHSDPMYTNWLSGRLAGLRGKHTVVILAHNLKSALSADQVIVLSAGRVREQGSPAELAVRGGPFQQLLAAVGHG